MPLLAYAAYKITSTATGNTSLDGNIVKKGNSLYLLDDPATEYTINFTRDLSVTAEKGIISFTEDEITADTTSITVYASDIDMSKTVGGSNDTLTLTISVGDREKSVVLQETAVEGIFSGTIAVNQKDSIAIYAGETLTASYTDSNAGNQQTCTISQEISAAFNDIAVELTKIIADDYTADYKVDQWSSFHILLDKEDVASGKYLIAKNVSNFSNDITLYHINTDKPVAVKPNSGNVALGNKKYSVELQDGNLMLNLDYLTIDSTQAGASRFSWQSEAQSFIAGITKNNFTQELRIKLSGMSISTYGMAEGSYKWRVKIEGSSNWYISNDFKAEKSVDPQKFVSDADGDMDVFFAENKGTWSSNYSAQHQGIKDGWKGSGEQVKLAGKNIIADVFVGSSDANVLVLTDSANGDALFVDDIYTALPGTVAEQQARIAQIDEIRAGAGDDIVDMTSQRFIYIGDGVKIYGGDDNDTLWANNGSNTLFGDAGNDRIVGGANNDVIVGGIGNDSMHGGGGSDIFCFGGDWGTDTVEQLANGSVTLWFEEGSESNWDADTLTYTDGANSVTVSGVTNITLRFGADSSLPAGCFDDAVSEKIFEDKTKGLLA